MKLFMILKKLNSKIKENSLETISMQQSIQ